MKLVLIYTFQLFLIIFFLACFFYSQDSKRPSFYRLGAWSMFTQHSTYNREITAYVKIENSWKLIELNKIFPSKWDSGYRYQRGTFLRSKKRMDMLSASICSRIPNSKSIRVYVKENPIELQDHYPLLSKAKESLVHNFDCNDIILTPAGKPVL